MELWVTLIVELGGFVKILDQYPVGACLLIVLVYVRRRRVR